MGAIKLPECGFFIFLPPNPSFRTSPPIMPGYFMNHLLRPRIWRPSWRPRVSAPATYRSGTPRDQDPAVARWHAHLHGLATAIHEIFRLSGQDPWFDRLTVLTKVEGLTTLSEVEGESSESSV